MYPAIEVPFFEAHSVACNGKEPCCLLPQQKVPGASATSHKNEGPSGIEDLSRWGGDQLVTYRSQMFRPSWSIHWNSGCGHLQEPNENLKNTGQSMRQPTPFT